MIRLVSCGIGNARDKEIIPCARKDAEVIYDSFQRLFPNFDNCYSITLHNATSDEFKKAVQNAAKGLKGSDVLVIYFSGHAADYTGDGIKLLFYGGESDVFFSNHLLDETLSECNKLLILDCCHAGGAASLANYKPLQHKKFFILATTSSFRPAEFGESISPFTQRLVNSLDELDSTNHKISVVSINRTLKKNGDTKSKVAIPVGNEDLILKSAVSTAGNTEFLATFWSKLSTLPSPHAGKYVVCAWLKQPWL